MSPELAWKPYVNITEEYAVIPEGAWSFPLKAEYEAQSLRMDVPPYDVPDDWTPAPGTPPLVEEQDGA
eukprot:9515683-Prorocentrum_lima.AAC.1